MVAGDYVDVCTVVTKPHFAQARVLARTLAASNPSAQLYVLLADKLDGAFDPAQEPFKVISLDQLGYPEFVHAMCFYYTPFELCGGLRGLLHEYMWNQTKAQKWLYLDSDIYVLGDLSEIYSALDSASVLLTPHLTSPASDDFFAVTELLSLRCGIFNSGFVGIRRCDASGRFIEWFSTRLVRHSFANVKIEFVDQLWLNYAPIFFPDVRICAHPGVNMGHWNLYKRNLTRDANSQWLVDGRPPLIAHFSGWEFDNPGQVSRYSPHYGAIIGPQTDFWRELGEKYHQLLFEAGHETVRRLPYGFARFDNGRSIRPGMRRLFYEDFWSPQGRSDNPFACADEFFARPFKNMSRTFTYEARKQP